MSILRWIICLAVVGGTAACEGRAPDGYRDAGTVMRCTGTMIGGVVKLTCTQLEKKP